MLMRMFLEARNFFLLAVIFVLSGCSGPTLLNAITPRSGYTVYSDILYDKQSQQKLDIYVPDKIAVNDPVILFFYGGSWQYGSKNQYRFVGQALASRGFVTVIADYRLYPEVYFPTFMDDSADALVWVHTHIQAYGGSPQNIFVAGHSAGGFNAVMLSLNPAYLQQAGGKLEWIRGTIGIAGPYDFLPFTDPKVKELFSKVSDAKTQPINYVTTGLPPMLLANGLADTKVYPKNAINLSHKLQLNHDDAQLILYPHVGHIGIIISLSPWFRSKTTLLNDMTQFVNKNAVVVNQKK
jgi:acetyl esterase/lipase